MQLSPRRLHINPIVLMVVSLSAVAWPVIPIAAQTLPAAEPLSQPAAPERFDSRARVRAPKQVGGHGCDPRSTDDISCTVDCRACASLRPVVS